MKFIKFTNIHNILKIHATKNKNNNINKINKDKYIHGFQQKDKQIKQINQIKQVKQTHQTQPKSTKSIKLIKKNANNPGKNIFFFKAKTSKTTKHIETSSNISNYAQATDCIISAPMVELVVRSTIWVLAVPDIASMNLLATNSAKNHD